MTTQLTPLATLLVVAAASLAAPAQSQASTVSTDGSSHITYVAGPGEDNRIEINQYGDDLFISDSVPIGSNGCKRLLREEGSEPTRHGVLCHAGAVRDPGDAFRVKAGDGRNTVEASTDSDVGVTMTGVGATWNIFRGSDGEDSLIGGPGLDRLYGGARGDRIEGRSGKDFLDGNGGHDRLRGETGNDRLKGSAGRDVTEGGPGADTVDYRSRTDAVRVSLDSAADDGEPGEGDNVVSDVENVAGGHDDDRLIAQPGPVANTLTGNEGDDTLVGGGGDDSSLAGGPGDDELRGEAGGDGVYGGAGDDDLDAGAGRDLVLGESGADLLIGGLAADTLGGGSGGDTVSYAASAQAVRADLTGSPADDGRQGEHDSIRGDVENLIGSTAADLLVGDSGANLIRGLSGDDEVRGDGGADRLFGNRDEDTLRAKDGEADAVNCGAGADLYETDAKDQRKACESKL